MQSQKKQPCPPRSGDYRSCGHRRAKLQITAICANHGQMMTSGLRTRHRPSITGAPKALAAGLKPDISNPGTRPHRQTRDAEDQAPASTRPAPSRPAPPAGGSRTHGPDPPRPPEAAVPSAGRGRDRGGGRAARVCSGNGGAPGRVPASLIHGPSDAGPAETGNGRPKSSGPGPRQP